MPEPRHYNWKDFVRITAGIIMLVLGVIGLVLPVLQGMLFLIIAALLLAPYSKYMQDKLEWSKQRFPGVHARANAFKRKYFPGKRAQ